jgi:asparagine synthase (glutamine-hydrolysing)
MCGITGFLDFNKRADRDDLVKITGLVNHRGPDDTGYFFQDHENFNIGLGHKRLSILDLSSLGHQPMRHENLSIVYNGEIYNFKEIREQLVKEGYSFTSGTDTEVILKAFHRWNLEALQHFNGMFAIALYDHGSSELYLIRDRIGVKPLYYYYKDSTLVFASELKSIINYPGFEKELDLEALNMYLYHGYITSPYCIFRNVAKLEPGTYIKATESSIEKNNYWDLKEKFEKREVREGLSEEKAVKELDELVTSSVGYRMISDAPIGAFLSGGYDSSLVSAVMQKISNAPIKTFTIGFNSKDFNEAGHAKEVAKHLKTDHHELYLPVSKISDIVEKIPQFYDEPFADSSQLPMMLVSEFARKDVTVILSGDGGDELFCGYSNYDRDSFYEKYSGISSVLNSLNERIPLEPIARSIHHKFDKYFHLNNRINIINLGYIRSKPYLNGLVKDFPYTLNDKYFITAGLSDNIQEAHMLQDMLTYLPDDIMVKVDRATMSASLEGREPLLDYRLFEFAFNIPHKLKCNGPDKKYLLKKLAHKYIPEKLLNRPKKGFAVPINEWLKGDVSFLTKKYLSKEYLREQGIFTEEVVARLINKFLKENDNGVATRYVWHLIVFQLWYERYMK